MRNYRLIELKEIYVTQGLDKLIEKEFSIGKGKYSDEDVCSFIDFIVEYLISSNKKIKDLETFGYGSWLFQFVFVGYYIELHELKKVVDGTNVYENNLNKTIGLAKEQNEFCLSNKIKASIPKIGQKIALSKDIYDGSEVNGVRYDAPEHMSGWYLTSNSYDGDAKSLVVDHLYHIIEKRPDLIKFLALPSGYRFYKDKVSEKVWLDEEC